MPIASLQIRDVGLFDKIEFEFDPQINVLVGPNNCGKTTALFTIADIAVYPFDFPRKHLREGSSFNVLFGEIQRSEESIEGHLPISSDDKKYWPKKQIDEFDRIRRKLGFASFTPALRVGTDFKSLGPVMDTERTGTDDVDEDEDESFDLVSSFIRDKAIIQDLVNLDYQSYREAKPTIRGTIDLIASVASQITEGFPVKFAGVKEEKGGLVPCFDTPDGRMPLNVLSQGTQGLILWLTRFIIGYARYYDFPVSYAGKPGVLIIDEIDAHLHPSWQRRILPVLSAQFPALQIFCSTHSPLLLAGLKRGQIQLLHRGSKGKVTVTQNETDVKGWSADEIYSGFLEVENPTDFETDNQLERLEELRSKKFLSPAEKKELEQLRKGIGSALRNTPSSSGASVDSAVAALTRSVKALAPKRKAAKAKRVTKK